MVTPQTTMTSEIMNKNSNDFHNLTDKWTLWAHLPHDIDWTTKSYKKIYTIDTVESAIAIMETMPEVLVKNCMLFIMRDGIAPVWEDPQNRTGGCFSYKIANKNVYEVWRDLSYVLMGETISQQASFVLCVTEIKGLISQGCLFKKHTPEY